MLAISLRELHRERTMAQTDLMGPRLYGPFLLREERIDVYLLPSSPGIYALGYMKDRGFMIYYLGRSDADLKADLKKHVRGPYDQFKFAYALSAEEAFQKQCELYHECVGLENDAHPRPPGENGFACPFCAVAKPRAEVLTQ